MEQQSITEPEIDIELSDDPEEALREICDIQYNQCYREAIENFKNMTLENIIKTCQVKKELHDIDTKRHDPKNSSYEEKFKILMDCFEVDAYRDAGKAILKLGIVN